MAGPKRNKEWPCEFLGRCAHCLDNAYLDQAGACMDRFSGRAVSEPDCLVLRVRNSEPELKTHQPA